LRVITNGCNRGFTRSINQALRHVRGEYVALINNDILVFPGWLEKLQECLESDRRIGAVCPALDYVLEGDGRGLPRSYSGHEGLKSYARAHERMFGSLWIEVPLIPFWCVLFRRQTLLELGPPDETLHFNSHSDGDYCFGMLKRGLRLMARMDVFVHHYGAGTVRHLETSKGSAERAFRNMILKRGPEMLEYLSHMRGEVGVDFICLPLGRGRAASRA
jgi:GT2 family glycosyltransferase